MYQISDQSLWQGRADSLPGERFFQVVQCIDKQSLPEQAYALLGFACDAGVLRNLGRPGSAHGPNALRQALAKLPATRQDKIYDLGDVVCQGDALEPAQAQLAECVQQVLQQKSMPIILGGGHETAWGHYQGIAAAGYADNLGIINFDAHFDLRIPQNQQGSSGTPFYQIAQACQAAQRVFSYCCLGIQEQANSASLFTSAKALNVSFLTAQSLMQQTQQDSCAYIQAFLAKHTHIYLSICLDVFAAAVAPGVSAPQALGLYPMHVLPLLQTIMASGKVIALDIVELAPPLDRDAATARLAAALLAHVLSALDS